jgi:hypothetical protein
MSSVVTSTAFASGVYSIFVACIVLIVFVVVKEVWLSEIVQIKGCDNIMSSVILHTYARTDTNTSTFDSSVPHLLILPPPLTIKRFAALLFLLRQAFSRIEPTIKDDG